MAGDFIDDFHEMTSRMADELELEGEDRDGFIDSAMERKGYRRVTSWAVPEPDDGDGGQGRRQMIPPRGKKAGPRGGGQGGQGGQGGRQGGRSPYFGANRG